MSGWDVAWADLLNASVTIAVSSSRDGYGKSTFAAGTSYSALVLPNTKRIRTREGEDRLPTTVCYVKGSSGTTSDHQITLADATTPAILLVESITDEGGTIGEVIYAG